MAHPFVTNTAVEGRSVPSAPPGERLDRRRLIAAIASQPMLYGLTLFWPAGTLAWPRAWLMLGALVPAWVGCALYVWRTNPRMIIARSNRHEGTKRWDRLLLACLLPFMPAVFVVSGLDARYGWSTVGLGASLLGYALIFSGLALSTWTGSVNPFYEPTVRIQSERGHRVIDTGPYALVRHPGYVGATLIFGGFALALDSYWALVPAGFVFAGLVLRTHWEDQTLAEELPGYRDYQARVRYRLVPGVW
jgi:protein-S-isoprenylcysteine O-methyltransferase Ste14